MAAGELTQRPGCARIAAGVERTLAEGGAEVVVTLEYDFPAEPGDGPIPSGVSTRLHGVIDFGADRTRLTDGEQSLVCDGPTCYQAAPGGQWTHQAGRAGQWHSTHPRWALEALRQACQSAEPVSGAEDASELAREVVAALTFPGLARDWRHLRATTVVDDAGRVSQIEITAAGTDSPGAWMRTAVDFTSFDRAPAQIDLPASSIDPAEYLDH